MAESLPARRALYKKTTDPDDAWVEAVGWEFQAEPDVEYEICCVGPSAIRTVSWDFETFMVSDGNGGFETFQVSDGEGGHEDLKVIK